MPALEKSAAASSQTHSTHLIDCQPHAAAEHVDLGVAQRQVAARLCKVDCNSRDGRGSGRVFSGRRLGHHHGCWDAPWAREPGQHARAAAWVHVLGAEKIVHLKLSGSLQRRCRGPCRTLLVARGQQDAAGLIAHCALGHALQGSKATTWASNAEHWQVVWLEVPLAPG